jgi:hypothetical protein
MEIKSEMSVNEVAHDCSRVRKQQKREGVQSRMEKPYKRHKSDPTASTT